MALALVMTIPLMRYLHLHAEAQLAASWAWRLAMFLTAIAAIGTPVARRAGRTRR